VKDLITQLKTFLGANPMGVFTLLASVVAVIYLAAGWKPCKRLFNILPPVFWVYFLPMALATIGVFPEKSATYNLLRDVALPGSLFLLFISVSIPDIIRLGSRALAMMLIGSFGIIAGAVFALLAIRPLFAMGLLPREHMEVLWKGIAALSGSWIGGSANLAAVWESVVSNPPLAAEKEIYSAMIAVDVIIAYPWMAFVMAMSSFQSRVDRWNKADTRMIEDVNERMKRIQEQNVKPLATDKFLFILASALLVAFFGKFFSDKINTWLESIITSPTLLSVLGSYTILMILVTIVGLGLSFTPVRRLEDYGASRVGYVLLYLALARLGAMANLNAIGDYPWYILMGIIWVAVHAGFLIIGARILKAPMFFAATSSQANIGGPVSAPIVAAAYQPNLAVVGLLMAVLGGILGTFLALFGVGLLAQIIL